jgi:hypothetical protein
MTHAHAMAESHPEKGRALLRDTVTEEGARAPKNLIPGTKRPSRT